MVALGALAVVLGGLVAAVTGPFDWAKGSWAAAYLVLVVGVAQYLMGWVHRAMPRVDPAGWVQLAGWNLGSLLVIGGTLIASPGVVVVGSVLLVIALVVALCSDLRSGIDARAGGRTWLVWVHRGMLLVMLVSIPVGIALSFLRH